MRWADLPATFARPIVSILALLGTTAVPFEAAGVRSGRTTFGHRFMAPAQDPDRRPGAYAEALRSGWVIVDPAERRPRDCRGRRRRRRVGRRAHPARRGTARGRDPPGGVPGAGRRPLRPGVPGGAARGADHRHAGAPEVLRRGRRRAAADAALRRGQQHAGQGHGGGRARARAGAAGPFGGRASFSSTRTAKPPLERMAAKLKTVLFQAQLGIGARQGGTGRAAGALHGRPHRRETGRSTGRSARAARLCKADLVSHMVGEFPKLQGTMGRVYALLQGEPRGGRDRDRGALPSAWPAGAELPATEAGAVLAIADKLDTICGCFRAGLIPTGRGRPLRASAPGHRCAADPARAGDHPPGGRHRGHTACASSGRRPTRTPLPRCAGSWKAGWRTS